MKKFLRKTPVMITFIALAVVMLVVYIGMLVRPVAIGMTYKGKIEGVETSVKVKNGSEVVIKVDDTEMEGRYVVKGREVYFQAGDMSDKEYKELKEDVLENWEEAKEYGLISDTNAFAVEFGDENLTCAGSIVFAAVGGVVTVALVTFATLSLVYFIKKK